MPAENSPETRNESFDQLEVMFTDPVAERTLELARTYTALFAESDPTQEEKNEAIAELDAAWNLFIREPIRVTGNISLQQDGNITVHFLDGQIVTSNGFAIIDDPMYRDGELYRANSRVVYHLHVSPETVGLQSNQEGGVYGAVAELDTTFIDFTNASKERAVPWLTYAAPELLEDIDTQLFSSNGTEADAVVALKDVVLPSNFEQESELTKNTLIQYLNDVIEFDTLLPYELSVKGDLYVAKKDNSDFIRVKAKIKKALVYISAVGYLENESVSSDGRLQLVLNALLLGESKKDTARSIRIPFNSLKSLRTVRSRYMTED